MCFPKTVLKQFSWSWFGMKEKNQNPLFQLLGFCVSARCAARALLMGQGDGVTRQRLVGGAGLL